jgi:hypothetical protein
MRAGWIVYHREIGDFRGFSMRILYVIFVLCVGALVWAAVAAGRHILRHQGDAERRGPSPIPSGDANGNDGRIALPRKKAHHD